MTDAIVPIETTQDALLGGRVSFQQPAQGYRAAIDPVLLAASVPPAFAGRVADLGCGAGAAALCLAARLPDARVVGIERDADVAALAARNVDANRFAARVRIECADIARLDEADGFDAVIANPPYLEPTRANAVAEPRKAAATVEGEANLVRWIDSALRLVRAKGLVSFIQRADRLADMLMALQGRAGEIVVFPLWPKQGVAAKRVIVRARKGLRTPLTLSSGLILHAQDGRYTPEAEAILRDGGALQM